MGAKGTKAADILQKSIENPQKKKAIKKLFESVDENDDGVLEYEEFEKFLVLLIETQELDELVFQNRTEEQNRILVDGVLELFDKNHDQVIDFEEFAMGIQNSSEVIKQISDTFSRFRMKRLNTSIEKKKKKKLRKTHSFFRESQKVNIVSHVNEILEGDDSNARELFQRLDLDGYGYLDSFELENFACILLEEHFAEKGIPFSIDDIPTKPMKMFVSSLQVFNHEKRGTKQVTCEDFVQTMKQSSGSIQLFIESVEDAIEDSHDSETESSSSSSSTPSTKDETTLSPDLKESNVLRKSGYTDQVSISSSEEGTEENSTTLVD